MRQRTTLGVILVTTVTLLGACSPAMAAKPPVSSTVVLNAQLATPVLLAGEAHTAYLKVGLEGLEQALAGRERTPVNIAIVLDKSSSMGGEKIAEARRAAIMAVENLHADDIVSVITYDSVVSVPVPAMRAADKAAIIGAIREIRSGGMTALFAGVSKGAAELRKYFDRNRFNRIILLSDGMANVGPSAPGELAELGTSLGREGISVSTIGLGLGYNEDLMFQLAMASDGNHAFVEQATDLAKIFTYEFGDVFSVVAQDVEVRIDFDHVTPLRVLGRDALIEGQRVTARLNQVYAGQEKFLMLEVEVPPLPAGAQRNIARVQVAYADMGTKKRESLGGEVLLTTSTSAREVEKRTNADVMVDAVALLANERNRIALALRDEGKIDEARQVLKENEAFVRKKNRRYRSKKLERIETRNKDNADKLEDPAEWNRTRKQMRKIDFEEMTQQSY